MSIGGGQFHINTKMGVIAGLCIVKGDTVRLVNGANEQLLVFDSNREILYDLDRHPIWVLKEMGYDKITLKKNNWQIIHDVGFVDQDGFINVMTKCVKYGFQYEFHHSGLIKKISKYAIDGILEFEIFFDEQSRFVELKEYK